MTRAAAGALSGRILKGTVPWAARVAAYSSAAAGSALLLALATAPYERTWLAWLAPFPLFLAIAAAVRAEAVPGVRVAALVAGFWGFLALLFVAPWFSAYTPVGYVAAALYRGVPPAVVWAVAAWCCTRRSAAWWPPLLVSGWVLVEQAYALGPLAFPWGTLAATQHANLPLLQVVELTGAYGLSAVVALPAASLAVLLGTRFRRAGAAWLLVAAAVAAVGTMHGRRLLAAAPEPGETIRVALVQASRAGPSSGPAVNVVSYLADYEEWTLAALAKGPALVVWGESACDTDAVRDAATRARLARLTETGTHLLVGSFVRDPDTGRNTNAAVMLGRGAEVLGNYAKVLIVPFGEYLPLRPLLGWTVRLGMPASDLRAGTAWEPLPWPHGRVGVSICFESAFGEISRRMVLRGANLLAVLTSDGWVGREGAALQHAAFAPLRAVETRRSVLRAAATGISTLIDPYGRPGRSLPLFAEGVVAGEVALRNDLTLYARLGDWPVAACLVVLLAAAMPARRGSEQRRRDA